MDTQYYSAFAHYLKTGDANLLLSFLDENQSQAVLSIYRNGFYKACIDALAANYTVTKQLLTESIFNAVAKKYVDLFPPQQGSLVGYGEQFIHFLAVWNKHHGNEVPVIAHEVAALDHGWISCLNSEKEDCSLTGDWVLEMDKAGTDPGSCEVRLSTSVNILNLQYNSFELWHEMKSSGVLPTKFYLNIDDPAVMFWRLGGQVHAKVLTHAESFFFLKLKENNMSLGALLESAVGEFPDFDVAEHFSQCLQNLLLAHCK